MRRFARFGIGVAGEIGGGRIDGAFLFGTHGEIFRAGAVKGGAAAFKGGHRRFQFGQSDFVPFAAQMFDAVLFDIAVKIVVKKQSAVVAHGVGFKHDFSGLIDRF